MSCQKKQAAKALPTLTSRTLHRFFKWVFLPVVLSNQFVTTFPSEQKNLRVWKMYLSMQLHHLADEAFNCKDNIT